MIPTAHLERIIIWNPLSSKDSDRLRWITLTKRPLKDSKFLIKQLCVICNEIYNIVRKDCNGLVNHSIPSETWSLKAASTQNKSCSLMPMTGRAFVLG